MSVTQKRKNQDIIYPDSDGKPMADNTLQFEWIAKLKGALEFVFKHREDVFVAGDLLWYPVEGQPKICKAPDALVAFERPKGYRGSYKQWEEDNIPPKVVFEVMSESNDLDEMLEKHLFYYKYGVEEFYVLDPKHAVFWVWALGEGELMSFLHKEKTWTSKILGIQIRIEDHGLELYFPNGESILTYADTREQLEAERKAKEEALAEIERLKAELRKQSGKE